MAAPGSTHYGYYFISYEFVYVGNKHSKFERFKIYFLITILLLFCLVRNGLIVFALFSLLAGLVVLVTSILLVIALRKVRIQIKVMDAL